MSAQAPSVSSRLAVLDGLRGVAVFTVIIAHAGLIQGMAFTLPHVHLAVDFFFMLSGYVVAKAYESRLQTTMNFADFVIVRMVRLYPMIFAGAMIGATYFLVRLIVLHTINMPEFTVMFASSLLLLPTMTLGWTSTLYPINPPEWSLFFELAVNFAYAALILRLSTPRVIVISIASFIALAFVVWIRPGLNFGFLPADFLYGIFRVTFPFSVGVLLFRLKSNFRIRSINSFALAIFMLFLFLNPFLPGRIYDLVALALILPAFLFLSSVCEAGPRLTAACLAIGEVSYPIYLTHYPILQIIGRFAAHQGINAPWTIATLSLAASVVISAVLLVAWDRPIRKWASNMARSGGAAVRVGQS